MVVIIPLPSSVALNLPYKTTENIKHVQSKSLPRSTLYLAAVKNQETQFFPLSPMSLLLGVIQHSNEIIMDDRQTIFGRQRVSLPNFFVAADIVHYLPKFVTTWNPPLNISVAPTKYFFKVPQVGRFIPLVGVSSRCVESPLQWVVGKNKMLSHIWSVLCQVL